MVGLTALAVLTRDARLALTLPSADVTLPIGGAQSVAVTPEEKHKIVLEEEEQSTGSAPSLPPSLPRGSELRTACQDVKVSSLMSTFCECCSGLCQDPIPATSTLNPTDRELDRLPGCSPHEPVS